MNRNEFEAAAKSQNAKRSAEVAAARESAAPCNVTPMLAFGGVPYCTAHRVMGPCPFAAKVAR